MSPLKAIVRHGRLVLDEPTQLPDGTIIELIPAGDDELDDLEAQQIRALIERAADAERNGGARPVAHLIDKIRASR